MEILELDSLIGQDQLLTQMKEKEQKYHQIFQQLSSTRCEFRRNKQELDLLKITYKGAEEEIETLRDIIKQKKEIILEMREEIEEKTLQLNYLESENSQVVREKQELEGRVGEQESEMVGLRERVGERVRREEVMQGERDEMRRCYEAEKGRIGVLEAELVNVRGVFERVWSELSQLNEGKPQLSNKQLVQEIQSLVIRVNESKSQNETLQSFNTSLEQKLSQFHNKTQSFTTLLQQKQTQLKLLRSSNDQLKHQIKQLTQQHKTILNDKQSQISQLSHQYSTKNNENKELLSRTQELELMIETLERSSVESVVPVIRSVLGEELSALLLKYTKCENEEKIIIGNEIDIQCSEMIYNKSRLSTVDSSNQELRNRVIQCQEDNEILKIRIYNLERAYQSAIDDYRRSLKFKAICQTNKPNPRHDRTSSFKENLSTNY